MTQLSLQIPKRFHPSIVGKGGATIQQLQSTHGVSIHVPARDSPVSTVLVTGDPGNVQEAKSAIERLVGFAVSDQPLLAAMLSLSSRHYGALIGPSGSTLRQMESETGCSITVPARESVGGQVTVEGTQSGIQSLQQRLAQLTGETITANYTSGPAAQPQPPSHQSTGSSGGGLFGSVMNQISSMVHDKLNIKLDDFSGSAQHSSASLSTSSGTRQITSFSYPKIPLNNINEVLFFPETAGHVGHFDRFLQLLRSATQSVDVAIYTVSDDRISRSLMTMHEQGIKIRVFTEGSTMKDQGSDVQQLANVGIETRADSSNFLMHLKVAIIDRQCVLSGSFNWTRSASEGNTENVICTSNPALVSTFVKQFEAMWPTGRPINRG